MIRKKIPSVKKAKHSVLISWLVSYFFVLLIPVIISGAVYTQSLRTVEEEINQNSRILIKQVQQAMDAKMADVERLSLQIAWHPELQGVMYAKGPLENRSRFAITQILKDFRIYQVANGFIDDFYIFLHNSQHILSPNTSFAYRLTRYKFNDFSKISYEQWNTLAKSYHTKKYMPMDLYSNSSNQYSSIAYVQSLPFGTGKNAWATLVILLDKSRFMNTVQGIRQIDERAGTLLVIDENSRVLSSTRPGSALPPLDYAKLTDNCVIHTEVDQQKVLISCISSRVSGWKYVYILPSSIFFEKVNYIRKLIGLSILLCFIAGGGVAYLFTQKNYNPVQKIVDAIAYRAGVIRKTNLNEYQFIGECLENTFDEKDRISQKLKQQNLVLKSNFLAKLMKGTWSDNIPVDEALSSFEINFNSQYFAVMLFYIEDFSHLFSGDDQEKPMDKMKLAQFIIANVVEELAAKRHRAFMTETDGLPACLINISEDLPEANRQQLLEIAATANRFIGEEFNIDFTVSISSIHQGLTSISKAYQEALEALEYKMVMGDGQIVRYDDIKLSQRIYDYPLQMEQQLLNFIKAGDFENAKCIVTEIMQNNLSKEGFSVQMARCLLFDLVSTMIKALYDTGPIADNSFIEDLNPVDRLFHSKAVVEMKFHTMDVLWDICRYIKAHDKDRDNRLSEEVKQYAEIHYGDVGLSVSSIAEEFNLTTPYLSTKFKQQTGEGLSDYINRVRINKSKQLLKEQRLGISDIAGLVGYNNSNSFIRAFKRYEGITPGKYKMI